MIHNQEFSVVYTSYVGNEDIHTHSCWSDALECAFDLLLVETDEVSIYEARTKELRLRLGNIKNQVNGKAGGEFWMDLD